MLKLSQWCLLALDCEQVFTDKQQVVIKHVSFELYESIKQMRQRIKIRQDTIFEISIRLTANYFTKINAEKYYRITDQISEALHDDFIANTPNRIVWKEYFHALYELVVLEHVYCNTTINIHILNSLKLYDLLPRPPMDTADISIRNLIDLFAQHRREATRISIPNYQNLFIKEMFMKKLFALAKYGLNIRNQQEFELLRACEDALSTFYSVYTQDD
jgi:hypothetical protein